jgi:acyl-CoA synthetase (AMP-forming)/AMP-acid ligase II
VSDGLRESDALHVRVRAFAEASLAGGRAESFDALAVDIAAFQARHIPGFQRLIAATGRTPSRASEIPGVPVDAFRMTRVAAHPPEADIVRFSTSGTTGSSPGLHAMRMTETYRALSLAWGARALITTRARGHVVVALAPVATQSTTSSLGFMMRAFMEAFDGRAFTDGEPFEPESPARWLAGPDGVNVDGLRRAAEIAKQRGEPFVVLATSFALVLLLDALAGSGVEAPENTVVMTTGGFKGKTREIPREELARDVARVFGVPETRIIGEYGMTELSSQLYTGTLPGGSLRSRSDVFVPPTWLRVVPVDAETLEPVPVGDIGIARFVDLGNVDSAVAIVTQDLVRRDGPGVVLLGRRPGAPPRGCSLAIEEMVLGGGSA